MSKNTRTACCGHTPGAQPVFNPERVAACVCACHVGPSQHDDYGPTPVQRPRWPKTAGCETFEPDKQGIECPLVIRTRGAGR